jgi:hypothetical protein
VVSVIDKDKMLTLHSFSPTNGKELGRPSGAVPYGSIGMYRMIRIHRNPPLVIAEASNYSSTYGMSHETDNLMVSQIGCLALTARDVLVPQRNERKGDTPAQ